VFPQVTALYLTNLKDYCIRGNVTDPLFAAGRMSFFQVVPAVSHGSRESGNKSAEGVEYCISELRLLISYFQF
jgi:hypothetical protein